MQPVTPPAHDVPPPENTARSCAHTLDHVPFNTLRNAVPPPPLCTLRGPSSPAARQSRPCRTPPARCHARPPAARRRLVRARPAARPAGRPAKSRTRATHNVQCVRARARVCVLLRAGPVRARVSRGCLRHCRHGCSVPGPHIDRRVTYQACVSGGGRVTCATREREREKERHGCSVSGPYIHRRAKGGGGAACVPMRTRGRQTCWGERCV